MVLSCKEAVTRGVPWKKVLMAEACNFIKKETLAQVFSCEFYEFLRTPFLQNISGRLLLYVTCFAKVSLLLLKSCNTKVIITFRFIVKKLAHIEWDVIIPSLLRLLLKVWIWFRCQNRKFLSPWWRIISF